MLGHLFLAFITALSVRVFADQPVRDCGAVDYRDQMQAVWNQPMAHDPGWCSSYTASDLLSFKLKIRISAAGLALLYNDVSYVKSSGQKPWEVGGGSVRSILTKGLASGLCLESNAVSRDYVVQTAGGQVKENT